MTQASVGCPILSCTGGRNATGALPGGDEPRWLYRRAKWGSGLDCHGPDIDFASLFNQFDTLLMGRNPYLATRAMGGPPMSEVRVIVVSRTLKSGDDPDVTITSDPAATLTEVRKSKGKDIWLFGGGSLFRSLLDAELVNSVEVAVVPVLLGDGVPLLPRGRERRTSLSLRNQRVYPKSGIISLEYDVRHSR